LALGRADGEIVEAVVIQAWHDAIRSLPRNAYVLRA
jgi:hypothetical protein